MATPVRTVKVNRWCLGLYGDCNAIEYLLGAKKGFAKYENIYIIVEFEVSSNDNGLEPSESCHKEVEW
jgi:hypothetical protein